MNDANHSPSRVRGDGGVTHSAHVNRGRPEAAAAIWRWDRPDDDRAERASKARNAGALRALIAAVAAGAFVFFERPLLGAVAGGIGGLTLVLALASPLGAYAAVDRAVAKVGQWVGVALTWLLLTPMYYLVFAPFGLLFKRGRSDPMERRLEPEATTYWKKRERDRPLDRPY